MEDVVMVAEVYVVAEAAEEEVAEEAVAVAAEAVVVVEMVVEVPSMLLTLVDLTLLRNGVLSAEKSRHRSELLEKNRTSARSQLLFKRLWMQANDRDLMEILRVEALVAPVLEAP